MEARVIPRPSKDAFYLMMEGSKMLAQVERAGVAIHVERLDKAISDAEKEVKKIEAELKQDPVFSIWRREFGKEAKLGSTQQLARVLYDKMGIECKKKTEKGNPSVDEQSLQDVDHPFVKKLFKMKHLDKTVSTFLKGIRREVIDGLVHPFYNLHTAVTYRSSCIAEGTLIETVRDVSKHPKGVPIEKVKVGDYVYCYDDNLKLTVKKVLWAGKTGRREVIRLHWTARGKNGHLDLTPEHKVRLIDGRYVPAKDLVGDFRSESDSRRLPKIRTLAMGRDGDRIWQTGTTEMLDHRLVYETLVGDLATLEVVHHKDGNHLNNNPNNLERMTKSQHSKHHAPENFTEERRKRGTEIMRKMWANGDLTAKYGPDNPLWVHISKFQMLRVLSIAGGQYSKTPHDFECFKRKASLLGIDLRIVKDRYDRDGRYISRGRLKRVLEEGGRSLAKNTFGHNFYKLKRMMEQRGFPTERRWANQFGSFTPGNHRITKIEYINKEVDVYDLQVEEFHNFIANEICVHNSDSPNWQNLPKRNPELAKLVRECVISRNGYFGELDFKGIEVAVAAVVTGDKALQDYVRDKSKDMHRDMAMQIFQLELNEVTKGIRNLAKQFFVFAQFYGDWYKTCAKNLWEYAEREGQKLPDGTPLIKHLKRKGIKELGECDAEKDTVKGTFEAYLREVQDDFWGNRFRTYAEWKKQWWSDYQDNGYFITPTGFLVQWGKEKGPLAKNECNNNPIQGSAFHCNLWTMVRLQKWLNRSKMRTLLVGQVHDSELLDAHPEEIQEVLDEASRIVHEDLPKHYKWLTVPMEIEIAVSPLNGSWYGLQEWKKIDGVWGAA